VEALGEVSQAVGEGFRLGHRASHTRPRFWLLDNFRL
jgi:hypothetical protein